MTFFEAAVLVFLAAIAVELFLLISAAAWFTDHCQSQGKPAEQDDADWWKRGGSDT